MAGELSYTLFATEWEKIGGVRCIRTLNVGNMERCPRVVYNKNEIYCYYCKKVVEELMLPGPTR
jgi:hypothetical protein